jgi:hypothetical protein
MFEGEESTVTTLYQLIIATDIASGITYALAVILKWVANQWDIARFLYQKRVRYPAGHLKSASPISSAKESPPYS